MIPRVRLSARELELAAQTVRDANAHWNARELELAAQIVRETHHRYQTCSNADFDEARTEWLGALAAYFNLCERQAGRSRL